jgi:hypothetical protein
MIIHIISPPSIKIYNWIKDNLKNAIVFDIDNIYSILMEKIEKKHIDTETKVLMSFIKKNLSDLFQKEIDMIIEHSNKKKKNVIFIGINTPDPRLEIRSYEMFVKVFRIELHAEYKYYIDLSTKQLVKHIFSRILKETLNNVDNIIENTLKTPTKTFKINLKEYITDAIEWKRIYTINETGYKFVDLTKLRYELIKLLK